MADFIVVMNATASHFMPSLFHPQHTCSVPFIITVVMVAAAASREEFVDVSFLFGTPQVHE